MADIFRKKSLDKLSSPEQLDKMIVINSPMVWLALLGGGMIVVVTLLWGVFGRIPITETGKGVLLRQGTVGSVYSGTQGVITKTYIRSGDRVQAGDVLYEVQNQETELAIRQIEERIDKVAAVTYYSLNDEITQDNQSLINIKNQKATLDLENVGNRANLSALQQEYAKVSAEVNSLKVALDAAEKAYYGNIAGDGSSAVSYEYEVAYSEYQAAESVYQSAVAQATSAEASAPGKSTMEAAKLAVSQAQSAYNTAVETVYQPAIDAAKRELENANNILAAAKTNWGSTSGNSICKNPSPADGADSSICSCGLCSAYYTAYCEVVAKTENVEAANEAMKNCQEKQVLLSAKSNLEKLQKIEQTMGSAENKVEKLKKERDSKKSVYESKKAAYDAYIANVSGEQASSTETANAYSRALSEYNTARATMESLEREIKTMGVTVNVTDGSQMVQEESLETQFETAKAGILSELRQALTNYTTLTNGQQIVAPMDGVIYSTFVTNGSSVGVDSEVARISSQEEVSGLEAVYFLPLDSGKNIIEGMTVHIYPNTLPKEEYGHMTGKVTAVADYVTSYADLFTRVGDETMANTFTKEGAVVEVTCQIEADETTVSGYAWSSKKGETAYLIEGTLLNGNFVVEDVPPITMLIPKLKEMFHME